MNANNRDYSHARDRGKKQPSPAGLPKAVDFEEMLIGALLMDPERHAECARIVTEADFTSTLYATAWAAITRRIAAGDDVDYSLISADVEAAPETTDAAEAAGLLIRAIERVPYAGHAASYADAVHKSAVRRGVITTAGQVAQWAHEETHDVAGLVTATLRQFEALDDQAAMAETGDIRTALDMLARGEAPRGWSTGISCYDDWTPGIRRREVHTIAGYTGGGKTWTLCQMVNALLDQGVRVAVFSVEMPVDTLVPRLIANRSCGAALKWGRTGATFTDRELERITAGVEELSTAAADGRLLVYHDQTSLAQISAIVRQRRPDVVFVDYVQIMDDPEPRMTEYQATTANARGLQKLAQKAAVAVVMLSQVNEQNQRSGGGDLTLGLKNTGMLGMVSDCVIKIKPTDDQDVVLLYADKNRNGPDVRAGARAEMVMDKTTGRLTRKLAIHAMAHGGFIEAAAGVDRW